MTVETPAEISLAKSLLERVVSDVPEGKSATRVRALISPSQSFRPSAIEQAWDQLTPGTVCCDATLELSFAPWRHQCLKCGCRWESQMQDDPCQCGAVLTTSEAGPALTLVSIDLAPARLPTRCMTSAGDRRAS